VLGRTVAGMSYGVYSSGPGLKRLRDVIEAGEILSEQRRWGAPSSPSSS
jgi:hypothetical protein